MGISSILTIKHLTLHPEQIVTSVSRGPFYFFQSITPKIEFSSFVGETVKVHDGFRLFPESSVYQSIQASLSHHSGSLTHHSSASRNPVVSLAHSGLRRNPGG
jgi:hypothetical protein